MIRKDKEKIKLTGSAESSDSKKSLTGLGIKLRQLKALILGISVIGSETVSL